MMMDDFTIALPQWINLVACELEMYRGLDQPMADGRQIQDDSSHRDQSA